MRRCLLRTTWAVLAGALLAPATARAQSPAPPPELAEVRRRVAALEANLRALEQQQAATDKERARIETELALASMRVKESDTELAAVAAAESASSA